jgi:hypothetical protein
MLKGTKKLQSKRKLKISVFDPYLLSTKCHGSRTLVSSPENLRVWNLESQMMMAEGSSEVLVGLKVTRYFSHGENSINCNSKKKVMNALI